MSIINRTFAKHNSEILAIIRASNLTFGRLLINMLPRALILFFFILSLMVLVGMYVYKLSAHFRYLRIQANKKPGLWTDFMQRNFVNKQDAEFWKKSWLIYPLLFGVDIEEDEKPEIVGIKNTIKQANILIYLALIVCLIILIYTSKAYPEGLF